MADQPTENVPNSTLSALVATLIPSLVISTVYFSAFLLLRKSQRRFYAPRSYLGTLREEERTEALPDGWFNWIGPFTKIADSSALKSQSLDAYLFLRFLRMTVIIMFIGALITWPILFPVYITGGSGSGQLDMLSMSNIDKSGSGKYRYYATTFAGWMFFSFILFLVTRESIFFVNLRQAFLLSPSYASKISSRTVLFTSVPTKYRDETKLRQIYGSSVKRVWLTKDTTSVDELVNERDKVALKLEAAEIELIKTANSEKLKFNNKNKNKSASTNAETMAPEENLEAGSLSARWVPEKKRPTHRLGLFGLLGRKEDTIIWCRRRLEHLISATLDAQNSYKTGDVNKTGGVFIEFKTLADAQNASQTLTHHHAFQMAPRFIGINPEEVIWSSLKISWSQRVIRRLAIIGFVSALIIFWAIPVGFVGLISNVNYLKTYSALSWLDKIPGKIMGIITGLLPAVALGVLMSLVPIIIRALAKLAGEPSLSLAELFTQKIYFIFQVVQVFLVATVASAATALIKQAIDDPSSITTTLATKIPKASNFYISYFVVQGLTIASGVISQVVGFLIFSLMYKIFAKTPRSLYEKWAQLSSISWGSTLPVYTNIAVIGITYSCIAPLILGFATIGMSLFYCAYRYNILFVSESSVDTKGLIYPRALQQLLTGVYLAEICLIGLFVISAAIGPIILMVIFLIFTLLYHRCLNAALEPLLQNLPKTLMAREEASNAESIAIESGKNEDSKETISENVADSRAMMKPRLLAKFLAPHIYANYTTFRQMIPHTGLDPNNLYEASVADEAYLPPSVKSEPPLLWIPKDNIGISAEETAETGKIISITDEGASISDENKIVWDPEGSRPPIWRPRIFY
ncbi:Uncharacterized protein RSN1 [Golovinomyces cichoracearum]|uniref:Uncharacterized protein RSN1 n=1 Tax=Golovinomyces cichoracearum TaxID=62708 RepID=A0A420IIS4_9PEZI|nr:Uncharacterized protein RSN1 [Golovinomyces cichoracearum]